LAYSDMGVVAAKVGAGSAASLREGWLQDSAEYRAVAWEADSREDWATVVRVASYGEAMEAGWVGVSGASAEAGKRVKEGEWAVVGFGMEQMETMQVARVGEMVANCGTGSVAGWAEGWVVGRAKDWVEGWVKGWAEGWAEEWAQAVAETGSVEGSVEGWAAGWVKAMEAGCLRAMAGGSVEERTELKAGGLLVVRLGMEQVETMEATLVGMMEAKLGTGSVAGFAEG